MPVGLVIAMEKSDDTSHGFTSSAAKVLYAAELLLSGMREGGTISFCCFDVDQPASMFRRSGAEYKGLIIFSICPTQEHRKKR